MKKCSFLLLILGIAPAITASAQQSPQELKDILEGRDDRPEGRSLIRRLNCTEDTPEGHSIKLKINGGKEPLLGEGCTKSKKQLKAERDAAQRKFRADKQNQDRASRAEKLQQEQQAKLLKNQGLLAKRRSDAQQQAAKKQLEAANAKAERERKSLARAEHPNSGGGFWSTLGAIGVGVATGVATAPTATSYPAPTQTRYPTATSNPVPAPTASPASHPTFAARAQVRQTVPAGVVNVLPKVRRS